MEYNAVIRRIEQFDIETGREHLQHDTGQKDELQTAAIFEKYKDLFTPKLVRWAQARRAAISAQVQDASVQRRSRLLVDFFIDGTVGNRLKKLVDEEATFEAKATVSLGTESQPFRQLPVVVQNEDNRAKRKAWVKASNPVKAVLTRYERRMLKTDYKLLQKLAGRDYVSYYAEHKEVDLDAFASVLKGFLQRTDALHAAITKRRLAAIGVRLSQAEAHDVSVIVRGKEMDRHFPKERLVPALMRTLEGLGIDIDQQTNVHLDLEDRPKKVSRAFCSPIRIPEEIYLVMKPHGGAQDYRTLLHEAGHTEHFAHTDVSLAYELKHMGGHAVSESYAFLFEFLTNDEGWLVEMVGLDPAVAKACARSRWEDELFMLRRYSVKLLYELKLHRNDLVRLDDSYEPVAGQAYRNFGECYADLLRKATKVRYPRQNWLLDVDGGFYSADYLRAWMMEAHLRRALTQKFGKRWCASKEAGDYLKLLWRTGSNGRSINELAAFVGVPLDTSALEKDYEQLREQA
jgi:oligoendopeptidase F